MDIRDPNLLHGVVSALLLMVAVLGTYCFLLFRNLQDMKTRYCNADQCAKKRGEEAGTYRSMVHRIRIIVNEEDQ